MQRAAQRGSDCWREISGAACGVARANNLGGAGPQGLAWRPGVPDGAEGFKAKN
jgi:hypothetical protein